MKDCCSVCKKLDGKIFKLKKLEFGVNAPPMHPNCHCATAPYLDRKEFDEWLDGYSEHGLSYEDWKNNNSKPKLRYKLNNQLFGIKRLKLTKQEMATVPSAMKVYANAQPNDEMYYGRKMMKEYGDYCYSFTWYDVDDIVINDRKKIKAKNRS